MKSYSITSNDSDQRLDKFLKKLLPNASLSYIYKLVRKGNIKVITLENKKTKQDKDYKLIAGEQVQIFLSDTDITELQKTEKQQNIISGEQKLLKSDIAFEDENLLIVNKSPWLNVHPGDHKSDEVSLIEQVHDYYSWKLDSLTFKPSLIHRIDRDTSWIIMIAKSKHALTKLSDDFKKHDKLKKTYFCIVLWKVSRRSGTVTKKLQRIENAKSENKVQVNEKWLEAITHYKVLEEYNIKLPQGSQILTAMEVTIETGRMHQIRVHMATLWNPILWDKSYGDKQLNSYFANHYNISRQMLHAWKIDFFHPAKKQRMKVTAKLKRDMERFINILKR